MVSGGGPAGRMRSRPPAKQTKRAAERLALRQSPQLRGDFPGATGKIKDVSGGVPIQEKRPGRVAGSGTAAAAARATPPAGKTRPRDG